MAKQKQPEYRLAYYWNDEYAEYVFVLQQDAGSSFKSSTDVAEGDIEWAKRQAEHYGISLPPSYLKETAPKEEAPRILSTNEPPYPAKPLTAITPTNPLAMTTPTYPTPGVNQ